MTKQTLALALMLLAACRTTAPVATVEMSESHAPIAAPGVDSLITAKAVGLAAETFAPNTAMAERLATEGRRFARLADSLLGLHAWAHWPLHEGQATDEDRLNATDRFNDGATALDAWTSNTTDSTQARKLLNEAALAFESALEFDPFDPEIRHWLGRVYALQAQQYEDVGALEAAIGVLQRLVNLHRDRHDYIGLLASMYDRLETESASFLSAPLWERAALVAQDDAAMDPDRETIADSAAVFGYLLRSSRAFGQVSEADHALRVVNQAATWATSAEGAELIEAERSWILWDGGNLQTRRRYDRALENAALNPGQAAEELDQLLEHVTTAVARTDVRRQLSLAWYASGQEANALDLMQDIWRGSAGMDVRQVHQIRQDYAVMAYNTAQQQRQQGDLTTALAYLLQCEQLEVPLSARAALQSAELLGNNPEAALVRAHAAERRMADLGVADQRRLLRYIVELYRRMGDRAMAREYFDRLEAIEVSAR